LELLREAKMAKELDELAHEAEVILRLAWGLAEKSASDGVVAEAELVELERLVRHSLSLPAEYPVDIA
jgi:hypothetical protein